jgi:uncharacterized protein YcbK (DUF882 family)
MTMYTANFSRRELSCRCGCKTPIEVDANLARLAAVLQQLRELAGAPIIIASGYRCARHNKAVGGAEKSQHITGMAADIWSKKITPAQLFVLAEKIPAFQNGGIGIYSTWIHLDIRKGRARW